MAIVRPVYRYVALRRMTDDAVNKEKIAAIVAAADNQAAGDKPSIGDLTGIGLKNLELYRQKGYKEAIADASPEPTHLTLQAIIEAVNNGLDTTTEVVDIISLTGKTWMDRNLGATRAATGIEDEASYGDLYQWGRKKDGHESRNSSTTNTKATTADAGHAEFVNGSNNWTNFADVNTLWQSGLNDPCPEGYRIPTEEEF